MGELVRLDATDGTVFWRMETRSCWAEERGQDDTSNTHRVQKASEQHTTSLCSRRAWLIRGWLGCTPRTELKGGRTWMVTDSRTQRLP